MMSGLSDLTGTQACAALGALQQPADNYVNDTNVEMQWAMKAFHHAEVYLNLISSVDPSLLKLTKHDDQIYEKFRQDFPDLKVGVISDDEIKSPEGKEKWRAFCNHFDGQVEDFNMGTLVRLDVDEGVSENNTTVVPRIQFLALEIARNREGCNDGLRSKTKQTSAQQ